MEGRLPRSMVVRQEGFHTVGTSSRSESESTESSPKYKQQPNMNSMERSHPSSECCTLVSRARAKSCARWSVCRQTRMFSRAFCHLVSFAGWRSNTQPHSAEALRDQSNSLAFAAETRVEGDGRQCRVEIGADTIDT